MTLRLAGPIAPFRHMLARHFRQQRLDGAAGRRTLRDGVGQNAPVTADLETGIRADEVRIGAQLSKQDRADPHPFAECRCIGPAWSQPAAGAA